MGTYTSFNFKAKLKQDTPEDVLNALKYFSTKWVSENSPIIGSANSPLILRDELQELIDNSEYLNVPFFKLPGRTYSLFNGQNWDADNTGCELKIGKIKEQEFYTLYIKSEFKNYDDKISQFIDWIAPYIKNRKKKCYVATRRTEDCLPYNIYIDENNKVL